MDNIKHLFKHLWKRSKQKETGQGLVEYAILLIFVGIAVVAIVQVMGPTIDNTFERFVRRAPVAPPSLVNYTPPPTFTATATIDPITPPSGPAATSTIAPTETPVPTDTPVSTSTHTPTSTPTSTNTPVPPPCPYAVHTVPANGAVTVQAENFMCGGQGIAYNDVNTGGGGSCATYRTDEASSGVELENTSDTGGGCNVGWIANNEWIRYEVNTASTVQHYFTLRIASNASGRIRIRVTNQFGTNQTNVLTLPVTGGWQTWTEYIVNEPLFLAAGTKNIVEIYTEREGYNFNSFRISTSPPATPAPQGILFVVGDTNLNNGDRAVRDRLQGQGYSVILVDDNAATTADATGKQLVLISSTSSSAAVGVKFRDVNVPVFVWEVALYDEMNMTSSANQGTQDNERRVRIINTSHPIASVFPTGNLNISGNNQSLTWGDPNNNADVIATIDNDTDLATIFTFETGRTMQNGAAAPARRVGFFFTNDTAANLNADGWTLFDRAIRWALGNL